MSKARVACSRSQRGTAGHGFVAAADDAFLLAAGGEEEEHAGGVEADVRESVPDSGRYVEEVSRAGGDLPVAVEEFQLSVEYVEGLALFGVYVGQGAAAGRDVGLDQAELSAGFLGPCFHEMAPRRVQRGVPSREAAGSLDSCYAASDLAAVKRVSSFNSRPQKGS
nr:MULTISPECIES: hypothetical protein [unclassified Streptomyces]